MSKQQFDTAPIRSDHRGQQEEQKPLENTKILKVKKKMHQLQNKAYFFEGQLNPLSIQNKALKDQLIALRKSVLMTTDLLRNLLPVQTDPVRKLKLEMAGIEEVSQMVKEDWLGLVKELDFLKEDLQIKTEKIAQLQTHVVVITQRYGYEIVTMNIAYNQMKTSLNAIIDTLKKQIIQTHENAKKERKQLEQRYKHRLEQADRNERELKRYVEDVRRQMQGHLKVNAKLREQIAQNLEQFQKSKQVMKQIYEKIIEDKVEETKNSYEYVLEIKANQYMKLLEECNAKEQNYRMKLAEKHSEISNLSGHLDKCKQEIGRCKDEIWAAQLKLDEKNNQINSLEKQVINAKTVNEQLRKTMKRKEEQYEQQKRRMRAQFQEEELRLKKMLQNSAEDFQRLQTELQIMKKQIQDANQQVKKSKRKLRENQERHQKQLEVQKKKYQELQQQFGVSEKLLRNEIEAANKKLQMKELQLEDVIKKNKWEMDQARRKFEKQKKEIQEKNRVQMERIRLENQEYIKNIKIQYERTISEIQVRNNQYLRQLTIEHNQKMADQLNAFNKLKEQTSKLIQGLQSDLAEKQASLKILQQKYDQTETMLMRERQDFQRQMREQREKFQAEMKQQLQFFQKTLREKQLEFQARLQEKQREMRIAQQRFRQTLSRMQAELQNQINMLKQTNALEEVEGRYNRLMAQMQQKHARQIQRLNEQHNKQLLELSQKMQFDLTKLNQDLLSEKKAHEFSKMTKQQKIAYLLQKITNFKNELMEKEDRIIDLEFTIEKKNKELAMIDEIVAKKMKEKERQMALLYEQYKAECDKKVKQIQIQCGIKIKQIETERIRHSQQLYNEFQEIKRRHRFQLHRLQDKYEELERLFQERPSRAEDLNRIKQLIQERALLDREIVQYRKKVKEANEIVKYLNLQLQNYKDTYDIFGPNDSPLLKNKRTITNDLQSQSSQVRSLFQPLKALGAKASSPYEELQKNSALILRDKSQKRVVTQGHENSMSASPIRLFPALKRSKSIVPEEVGDQNQNESSALGSSMSRKKSGRVEIKEEEDKSNQLRSNAQIFLSLIGKNQNYGSVIVDNSQLKDQYRRKRTRSFRKNERFIKIKEKSYIMKEYE